MDQLVPSKKDLELDIESRQLDDKTDNINRVWNGYLSSEDPVSLIDVKNESLRSIRSGDKYKKCDHKALKPPRPPKGPSATAYDRKVVKEIAELAMRKRLRIERMKKLKTMRDDKRPSSCYTTFAITVTFIFFLLLFVIFQGLFSSTNATFRSVGSPAPAVLPQESLISVQFFKDFAPFGQTNDVPTSFR